jgi:hypothetical protein
MAHVDDWPPGRAPRVEQCETIRVDLLIPAARPRRTVESLLHVDGEEDGVVEIEVGFHRRLHLRLGFDPRSQKQPPFP